MTRFDELETADMSVAVPAAFSSDELKGELAEISGVSAIDTNEALFATAALQEFQGSEFTMNTCFYRLSDERELTKHSIEENTGNTVENGAYIPMYLSELGGYKTGGDIRYIIDGREYVFNVSGVVSEMQYGNYGTGFIGLYLTDKAYERIEVDENFTAVSEYLIYLPLLQNVQCAFCRLQSSRKAAQRLYRGSINGALSASPSAVIDGGLQNIIMDILQ